MARTTKAPVSRKACARAHSASTFRAEGVRPKGGVPGNRAKPLGRRPPFGVRRHTARRTAGSRLFGRARRARGEARFKRQQRSGRAVGRSVWRSVSRSVERSVGPMVRIVLQQWIPAHEERHTLSTYVFVAFHGGVSRNFRGCIGIEEDQKQTCSVQQRRRDDKRTHALRYLAAGNNYTMPKFDPDSASQTIPYVAARETTLSRQMSIGRPPECINVGLQYRAGNGHDKTP